MEACLHGLRNFGYPSAGIPELSCTLLTVDVLWNVCKTRVGLSAKVFGLGWVECWRWWNTWEETWDPVGTSRAGIGVQKKMRWAFPDLRLWSMSWVYGRIMNEQHLDSSCEGSCRCLPSASRTYFFCKMKRLDVVYELVLVILQSQ